MSVMLALTDGVTPFDASVVFCGVLAIIYGISKLVAKIRAD